MYPILYLVATCLLVLDLLEETAHLATAVVNVVGEAGNFGALLLDLAYQPAVQQAEQPAAKVSR